MQNVIFNLNLFYTASMIDMNLLQIRLLQFNNSSDDKLINDNKVSKVLKKYRNRKYIKDGIDKLLLH